MRNCAVWRHTDWLASIQRHLNNEQVLARPPSAAYKFQKAFRRNKLAFTAAAAVALALVFGLGLAALGWRQTGMERDKAVAAKQLAEESQKSEQEQRLRAKAEEAKAKRLLYAADMNLAQQSANHGNLGVVRRLLDRHRPTPGEEDLRGWEWRYLWQQCRSEAIAVLTRRPGEPGTSISFSPDGTQLAVGYQDGRVELWDVARRSLQKTLHTDGQRAQVAFSPRSNVLVATAARGNLKLHHLSSGRESTLWPGTNGVWDLSFTPDGHRLVVATFELRMSAAVTFDMARNLALRTNDTSGGTFFRGSGRLSSDGKRLFLSHRDLESRRSGVKCEDFTTGQLLWQADLGTNSFSAPFAIEPSPDDKTLVISGATENPSIQVLDAATGKQITRLEGHSGAVRAMSFARDGRQLASASEDQTIRLWSTSGDATGRAEARVLRGHGNQVLSLAFSPDGRMLASAARDGDVLLWDTRPDQKSAYGYRLLPGEIRSFSEIAPGVGLANGPRGAPFRTLDGAPGRRFLLRLEDLSELPVPPGLDLDRPNTHFLPNHFVSYEQTNLLRVLELGTGWSELFREEVGPQVEEVAMDAVLAERLGIDGRPGQKATPVDSPGPRLLAWSVRSGTVQVAELGSSKRRWRWNSELRPPALVGFSPDGRLLILSGPRIGTTDYWQKGFEVREVATGNLLLNSDLPISQSGVRFADGGRKLVAICKPSNETHLLFWDLTRPEQPPNTMPAGTVGSGGLERPDVSPDGRWVSARGRAGAIALYDATTMERNSVLQVAAQEVWTTSFSPDSRRLVAGASGQTAIQLWQVDTGQELLSLPGRPNSLTSVFFAENGNSVLAGTLQRNAWQMWRAPSWEVIHDAEAKEKAEGKLP